MGWIAVDLDGTLARYHAWQSMDEIGAPVERMVARVKQWLEDGEDVRILTARVSALYLPGSSRGAVKDARRALDAIEKWSLHHLGRKLPVTAVKDFQCDELYDDRARQVLSNTGMIVGENSEGDYIPAPKEQEVQEIIPMPGRPFSRPAFPKPLSAFAG